MSVCTSELMSSSQPLYKKVQCYSRKSYVWGSLSYCYNILFTSKNDRKLFLVSSVQLSKKYSFAKRKYRRSTLNISHSPIFNEKVSIIEWLRGLSAETMSSRVKGLPSCFSQWNLAKKQHFRGFTSAFTSLNMNWASREGRSSTIRSTV